MSYSSKALDSWTNSDLIEFLNTINLKPEKDKILSTIKEYEATGSDFKSFANGREICESYEISKPFIGNRIFNKIKTIKQNEQETADNERKQEEERKEQERDQRIQNAAQTVAANNTNNNMTNNNFNNVDDDDNNNDGRFEISIFGQGKFWDLSEKVSCHDKVSHIKQLYKNASGCRASVNDISLYTKGKVMNPDNKSLKYFGVTDHTHQVTVKFQAVGGMAQQKERIRKIRFNKYKLSKSYKADCLTYEDDVDRADIGCPRHHAMTANTMYKYIEQVVTKNMKIVKIPCPLCKNVVLNWNKCTQIADMNAKEYRDWTSVIQGRLDGDVLKCPSCKAQCERKKGVAIFRMRCTACSGPDFCWSCKLKWNSGSLIWCGNAGCKLIDHTNKILREAPLITPAHLKNVKIPNVRACPKCLTFIEHKRACKHMSCPGCSDGSYTFCFVCMGLYDKNNNSWPCNSYTDECPPYSQNGLPYQQFK